MQMHNHLCIRRSQYHKTESLRLRSLANEPVCVQSNEKNGTKFHGFDGIDIETATKNKTNSRRKTQKLMVLSS